MQKEHEEMMRADFDRYTAAAHKWQQAAERGEVESLDALAAERDQVGDRWARGPHAEHWGFLNDALDDWKRSPEAMIRLVDDMRHNGQGATTIQARSLVQAGATAAEHNPKIRDRVMVAFAPAEQQSAARTAADRGIERSR
ncbi:hypothetical protein [Nocardia cyriacigeorgica]|uniref:hypothetical protein n=1 Tax=Nocardia cyriacigeorgica TaxID=135487 RepID=UPI002455D962|nr:hypothetical protein [Nocardia cyriacigeorgica]